MAQNVIRHYFETFEILLTFFQDESDFTSGMLGLDEVLRDAGVDASGLKQLGIQTGPRLTAQPSASYMDDEPMSDEDLPEDREQRRPYYAPQISMTIPAPTTVTLPQKKTKIVKTKRLVERKKSVYEIFPNFTPNRPLDFVDLFGQRAKKPSRVWSRDIPQIRKHKP